MNEQSELLDSARTEGIIARNEEQDAILQWLALEWAKCNDSPSKVLDNASIEPANMRGRPAALRAADLVFATSVAD